MQENLLGDSSFYLFNFNLEFKMRLELFLALLICSTLSYEDVVAGVI